MGGREKLLRGPDVTLELGWKEPQKLEKVLEERRGKSLSLVLHTSQVAWLEGDHLVSVWFGVLRFTVHFIL